MKNQDGIKPVPVRKPRIRSVEPIGQVVRRRVSRNAAARGMGAEVDTKWLNERMADQQLSTRKLGALMGLDNAAVYRIFTGERGVSAIEAAELARHLAVPLGDLLRHLGVNVGISKPVPVVAWLDAEGIGHAEGLLEPKFVTGPPDALEGLQAIRSQAGGFDGWMFFFRPADDIQLGAVGRLCLVQIAGEQGHRLRFLHRGYEVEAWKLQTVDGRTEGGRVVTAAPVVWIRQ